jgi:hypothetical protein
LGVSVVDVAYEVAVWGEPWNKLAIMRPL